MKRLYTLVLPLALVGFTTALAPQEKNIVTTQAAVVEKCEMLGTVEAHPPYIWPGDDLKQLKNKAAPLGADTVFVTGRFGTVVGVAYRCKPR